MSIYRFWLFIHRAVSVLLSQLLLGTWGKENLNYTGITYLAYIQWYHQVQGSVEGQILSRHHLLLKTTYNRMIRDQNQKHSNTEPCTGHPQFSSSVHSFEQDYQTTNSNIKQCPLSKYKCTRTQTVSTETSFFFFNQFQKSGCPKLNLELSANFMCFSRIPQHSKYYK